MLLGDGLWNRSSATNFLPEYKLSTWMNGVNLPSVTVKVDYQVFGLRIA